MQDGRGAYMVLLLCTQGRAPLLHTCALRCCTAVVLFETRNIQPPRQKPCCTLRHCGPRRPRSSSSSSSSWSFPFLTCCPSRMSIPPLHQRPHKNPCMSQSAGRARTTAAHHYSPRQPWIEITERLLHQGAYAHSETMTND